MDPPASRAGRSYNPREPRTRSTFMTSDLADGLDDGLELAQVVDLDHEIVHPFRSSVTMMSAFVMFP